MNDVTQNEERSRFATAVPIQLAELVSEFSRVDDALEKTVLLRKMEALIKEAKASTMAEANEAFRALQAREPGKTRFIVKNAVVKPYFKRATYIYPAELIQKELDVKREKEASRKNGAAIKQPAAPDPAVDPFFSVSV